MIDDKNSELQNDEEAINEEQENIENVDPSINNNENLESALLALSNATEKIHSSLTKVVNDSAKIVLNGYATIAKSLRTPAIDHLLESSLNPIIEALNRLSLDFNLSQRYKKLNEAYLKAMYEAKWFPYAGWIANMYLFEKVNEIINTSRYGSKNREKRIDKAILSYYTKTEIRNLKRSWRKSNLDYTTQKIICQAIEAYLRGEYVLTISCLSTMWEGLISTKANNVAPVERKRQNMCKTKDELKSLIEHNDYDYGDVFNDYVNSFILSNCNSVADVIEGVPNRHGVAHSWYKKYPNKKAALNAILLTDFIITLEPIEQAKENK